MGIPKSLAITTTGKAAYPPKERITLGFIPNKSMKAWIKPIGIFKSAGIVYLVNFLWSLPAMMGRKEIPDSGNIFDSRVSISLPSMALLGPIQKIFHPRFLFLIAPATTRAVGPAWPPVKTILFSLMDVP